MNQDAVHCSEFRFYGELNDFLAPSHRQRSIVHTFTGAPSVKDRIESLGVPHTEVDLIVVNGVPVSFRYRLQGGERVAVYPCFKRLDIGSLLQLRPLPLQRTAFILDVQLGRLARYLRLLGFDTLYRTDWSDTELAHRAQQERRILLTRDIGLLKRNAIVHGAFLHQVLPRSQIEEVLTRFDLLHRVQLYKRCAVCNGQILPVAREAILDRVPPGVLAHQMAFYQCDHCGNLYWQGSHDKRLRLWLIPLLESLTDPPAPRGPSNTRL